jgi:hypothetical protein
MTLEMEDRNALELVFNAFPWLRKLEGIYDLVSKLVIDGMPASLIAAEIRKTDVWRDRFGVLDIRANKGLPPMTEADYLNYEASFAKQFRDYNVYGLMFNSTEQFRTFVKQKAQADVSPQELSIRLDRGWAAVQDNQEVREAFSEFYGVRPSDQAMLLYFLDAHKGTQEIEREIAASIVGGEALAYGLNISRTRAELFASRGVTQDVARSGYADIAREQPMLEKLAKIHNYTPLTQTDLEDLFFHEDPDIIKRRAQVFNTALSEFRGPVASSQGTTELIDIRRTV